MPWNPDTYLQFKDIRYKSFFDLAGLIKAEGLQTAVDIGCGTGEQTAILSATFEAVNFLGIDSSVEMLAGSKQLEHERLRFAQASIEAFAEQESNWDLLFSNAALQWSDDHRSLFPKLINKVNPGGQFAVQMPLQQDNVLNKILFELVSDKPFTDLLQGFKRISPVLPIDDYTTIMFNNGLENLDISVRVYPIIAGSETDLYNFIAGSALIPYMERLDAQGQSLLQTAFLNRIKDYFIHFPAIYSFKRILMHGYKKVE